MGVATNVKFFYQSGVTSNPHVNLLLALQCMPVAGRLLVLAELFSQSHDWFLMRRANMAAIMRCTITQVRRAERQLLATGLFRLGDDGRLWRVYLPGETPDGFSLRCRRAPYADSRLLLYWTLAILGSECGVVRHSVAQLAAETGLHPSTVRRAVADLEAVGAVERSEVGDGRGNRSEYVLCSASPELREDKLSRAPKGARSGAKVRDLAQRCAIWPETPLKGGTPEKEAEGSGRKPAAAAAVQSCGPASEKRPPGPVDPPAPSGAAHREDAQAGYNLDHSQTQGSAVSSNAARVVRFPVRDSHVIPVLRRTPTFNFTRRDDAVAAMAKLVAVVRRDRAHREVDARQLASWHAPLRRLLRELKGGDPIDRVYRVLRWYADHHDDDEFIPVVESGRSLYDKFDRLEKAMLSRLPREERESPRDVLRRSVGDGRLLASFEETVYQPARRLGLAGDDLALATALGALYERLRSERAAARVPDDVRRMIGGVSDALRGYVSWLADQEWLGKATSSSVIRSDSKAFLQYRRLAALDGAHGDPITGRKTR